MDTSAIPTDQVNNTGTMNALINLKQRPTFPHDVLKWRPVKNGVQCTVSSDQEQCWCEPGKGSKKCWKRSLIKQEQVHTILKGGEDSIGALEALQRVYINIGSCAESAWVNHLTDMRQLDPHLRGFGQTPMDIGQARRDCPNFRAIEDRLPDLLNYLMTGAPADLREARGNERKAKDPHAQYTEADLKTDLERDFGADAVKRGSVLFAKNCATCHSSRPEKKFGPFVDRNFRATDAAGSRKDWLGSDEPTAVSKLDVNASRALHSNHMKGHLWEEYASDTHRTRPPVTVPMSLDGQQEDFRIIADGGRGYYRNISLLSVWAYAPFMHDNAIGPELCGGPVEPPKCKPFDPSVEGRYQLFKDSMKELLNPDKRMPKITRTNEAKQIGPLGIELSFPNDKPAASIGNYRHKEFISDLKAFLAELKPDFQKARTNPDQFRSDLQKALADPGRFKTLKDRFASRFGPAKGEEYVKTTLIAFGKILGNPTNLLDKAHELSAIYSNSIDLDENNGSPSGHPLYELFEDGRLSEQDKNDLTAFLATL